MKKNFGSSQICRNLDTTSNDLIKPRSLNSFSGLWLRIDCLSAGVFRDGSEIVGSGLKHFLRILKNLGAKTSNRSGPECVLNHDQTERHSNVELAQGRFEMEKSNEGDFAEMQIYIFR